MIEIHYKYHNRTWYPWDYAGQFSCVQDAFLRIKPMKPIIESPYVVKCLTSFGDEVYFKFLDLQLNDFIQIESPWKVGLNDRNSIQISKLG